MPIAAPLVVFAAALVAAAAAVAGPARDFRPGLVAEYSDGERRVTEIVSRVAFSLEAGESIHPALAPEFRAAYTGILVVLDGGRYSFPGPARVTVGGRAAGEEPIDLASGEHAIRIEFIREPGPVRFRALWRGEEFETEPIPASALAHAAEPEPEPESLARDAAIERGRDLADVHRCGACHAGIPARAAPDLSRAGERLDPSWIVSWLEDPRAFRRDATMPVVALNEFERRDVATYLGRLGSRAVAAGAESPDPDRVESGRALFESIGCVACHPKGSLGAQGAKTDAASLARFLLDPHAVDPEGGMPAFFEVSSPSNATGEGRAAWVAAERDAALRIAEALVAEAGGRERAPFEPGDARRGEVIVTTRGCVACHALSPALPVRQRALGLALSDFGADLGSWEIAGPVHGERGRRPSEWRDGSAFTDGDLHAIFPKVDNSTAWLRRTITLERPLAIAFSVEVDDRFTLAIDGETVLEGKRNNVGRPAVHVVDLDAGTHEIAWRVFDGGGEWRFRFEATPIAPLPPPPAPPPAFDSVDPERGCLSDAPAAAIPRFPLAESERDDLRAFVASRRDAPDRSPAPVHAFRAAVRRLRCTACHSLDGDQPVATLSEFPPPLSIAGEKMRASWLESVLLETKRVRPWMGLRMPRFAPALVREMPRGFHAHAGVEPGEGEAAPESARDVRLAGVKLLGAREFSCISCHDYKEWTALGTRGPDLREMHARIRPEWFRRWMKRPSRVLPGTSMPLFFGSTSPEETERRIDELAAALALGDHLPPPDGLVSASAERDTRRPIVVRTYLPGASPAAIAVGLPGLVSFGFDTLDCRVFLAWEGDFLDMGPAWARKGETLPRLLGRVFLQAGPGAFTLRVGDPARAATYRYRGHSLGEKGAAPEFRFDADGVPVSLRVEPIEGSLGLVLRYRVDSAKPVFLTGADARGARVSCEPGAREGGAFRVEAREFTVTIVPEGSR